MFLKRHFKPLLELKMFQATSDLNNIIIQKQEGIWSYQVTYNKILYQKVFYKEEIPSNNLSISFNLSEFLSIISQIHGSQQEFTILDTGIIEVYRKKDNTLLNTIQLDTTSVHAFNFDNGVFTNSIKNKDSIIRLCQACKRFSNEFEYYTGFNRISLFINHGLKVFSTDGLHSLEFLLSDSFKHTKNINSFYLGDDYDHSQECIRMLENFLTYSQEELLEIELSQTALILWNNIEKIILPLHKNDEFSSSQDIYDEESNDYTILDSKVVESILEVLNKKSISQYRKENDIKNSYDITCRIVDNHFLFNNEKIKISETNNNFMQVICVYHLIDFLNPKEKYRLYKDRLEGMMSILYF